MPMHFPFFHATNAFRQRQREGSTELSTVAWLIWINQIKNGKHKSISECNTQQSLGRGEMGFQEGELAEKYLKKIGFFKALLLYLDLFKNESKRFDHGKTKNFLKIFWRTRTWFALENLLTIINI